MMDGEAKPKSGLEDNESFRAFLIRDIRSKGMTPEELIEALADSHLVLENVIRECESSMNQIVANALAYAERNVSYIDAVMSGVSGMRQASDELVSGMDAYADSALHQGFDAGKLAAEKFILSTQARKAALARHALSTENKAKVFAWCDENMSRFSSMDNAAFDIAETFVDQKFRTVRDWMTEWKKLRSASTP